MLRNKWLQLLQPELLGSGTARELNEALSERVGSKE